jgi:hypothetical protein
MAEEPFALSTVAARSDDESDYEAICATVMESVRGRWFLEEHARRNRQADTALVLAAIDRLEHLIAGHRAGQGSLAFRAELLEMAKAISEARGQAAAPDRGDTEGHREPSKEYSGTRELIFATAERIHDVAWIMHERGIDPSTCHEIETLASSILTASSLQSPPEQADPRVEKLKGVLQQLEQRIHAMLDACSQRPVPTADASGENRAHDDTSPSEAGSDVEPAWETVPTTNSGVVIEEIAEPTVADAGASGAAVELTLSVAFGLGTELGHADAEWAEAPSRFDEHATTQSPAELELEPLLPQAQEKHPGPATTLEIPALTVLQPLYQSPGMPEPAELPHPDALSPAMQVSASSAPAAEMGLEEIELAPLPMSMPDSAKETADLEDELEFDPLAVKLPPCAASPQVMDVDESGNPCVEEEAELSSARGEERESMLGEEGSYAADSDSQCQDASFDLALMEKDIEELAPDEDNENTVATSSSVSLSSEGSKVSPRQPTPQIETPTPEGMSPPIMCDNPGPILGEAPADESTVMAVQAAPSLEDVAIRIEEGEPIDTLGEPPILSIETRVERLPDDIARLELTPEDLFSQRAPAAWDESTIPANEKADYMASVVEGWAAEQSLQSGAGTPIMADSIDAQGTDGEPIVPVEERPATAALSSMTENETLVLVPDENIPAPVQAPFTELSAQPSDQMLLHEEAEISHVEQKECESTDIVAETVSDAPDAQTTTEQDAAARSGETRPEAGNETHPAGATDLPFAGSEQTIYVPALPRIASESEHTGACAAALDPPPAPSQPDSTDIAHDDVLSGAWEDAVQPGAEATHQARLASTKPASEPNKDRSAAEVGSGLPLLATEVMESGTVSGDTLFDPIQEIEQELFAPAPFEPANVQTNERPARLIEELLPRPTLTEMLPTPSIGSAPTETAPPAAPAMGPVLQTPPVVQARRSMPRPSPADPLATLRAMTDEERIALFS